MTTQLSVVGDTRRLEQLLATRDFIDQEIASERHRLALADPSHVIEAAANLYGVTPTEIRTKSKDKANVAARQMAHWLLREQGLSLPAIASITNCHHTTVMHSLRQIEHNRHVLAMARNLLAQLQDGAA